MLKKPLIFRITTVGMSLRYLLKNQIKYIKENGYDVIMISAYDESVEFAKKNEQCEHISIPFTRKITLFQDLYCLILLIILIIKYKPDIIHTHTPKASLIGMLGGFICRVPHRVCDMVGFTFETKTPLLKKFLIKIEKFTCACATVLTPNSASIIELSNQYKIALTPKMVLLGNGSSNGVDITKFSRNNITNNEIIKKVKTSFDFNESDVILLAVSRMVGDKGINELVEAFIELQKNHPLLKLVLVGHLEQETDPLKVYTLSEINTNPKIFHIPHSDNVEYYMSICDFFIHASHREGFVNVLLEAGAMKCNVIASNSSGNVDLIKHNITGVLFEKNNTADLIEKIHDSLENKFDFNQISSNLHQEVITKYKREKVHAEILNFYNSLHNV